MQFLISTDNSKPDPSTRKLIRSHVMLGKNLGRTIKHRKKPTRTGRTDAAGANPADIRNDGVLQVASSVPDQSPVKALSAIPERIGSDLSLLRFADSIDPFDVSIVLKFTTIAKHIMFPLEKCLRFDLNETRRFLEPLFFDVIYLHTMVFATRSYFDLISGSTPPAVDPQVASNPSKVFRLLRERINSEDQLAKVSDATVVTVLILAGHAQLVGNLEVAKHHLAGLRAMVSLRGGISAFDDSVKLKIDILRSDLSLVFSSGTQPVFFQDPMKEPLLPFPTISEFPTVEAAQMSQFSSSSENLPENVDTYLAAAWRVLQHFCFQIDCASRLQSKISKDVFMKTMASVMYGLLHLKFEQNSLNEAIRLGLLAFSFSNFVQWHKAKSSSAHFAAMYRRCLTESRILVLPSQLSLWLLMIGSVTVFEKSDHSWLAPWLRLQVKSHGLKGWSELQRMLRPFLWIGLVHDRPGESIFNDLAQPST